MVIEKIYQIFIGFIENEINRGLNIAQMYIDISQRPIQTVYQFDVYLSSLETQFVFYIEKHLISHLFAKLKPEIRAIIVNFQTVPQKYNEFLSLATCLKNTFYKTRTNSSRGNQNNIFFSKKPKRKK